MTPRYMIRDHPTLKKRKSKKKMSLRRAIANQLKKVARYPKLVHNCPKQMGMMLLSVVDLKLSYFRKRSLMTPK